MTKHDSYITCYKSNIKQNKQNRFPTVIYIYCNVCIHLENAFKGFINENNKVLNTKRVVTGAAEVLWFPL